MDDKKREIIEALGAASMCWDPKPTGCFDSTQALAIADGLYVELGLDSPDPRLEAARELAKAGDALKVTMDEDAEIWPPDWHKFTDALAAFQKADGGE